MTKKPGRTTELIERLLDETISESESAELESILLSDKDARREYLIATQFASSMHFYSEYELESAGRHNESEQLASPGFPKVETENTLAGRLSSLFWPGSIGLLTLICALSYFWIRSNGTAASNIPLNFVSYEGTQEIWNGLNSVSGELNVNDGVLTLQTKGGSLISLEGPCQFQMTNAASGTLTKGRLVAYCGAGTDKLTINTSSGRYADLGTEFGVSVDKESSSLHVFDGQVFATETNGEGARVIEGASAITSDANGIEQEKSLVDLASFYKLRSSLSPGIVVEDFEGSPFSINRQTNHKAWKLNAYYIEPAAQACVTKDKPFSGNLVNCLSVDGETSEIPEVNTLAFLEAEWDYAEGRAVDVTKAHTIECLLRLDCEPEDVIDFALYGSGKSNWKDRSWSVSAKKIDEKLMWMVYNSPKATGSHKFQHLEFDKGTPFHILVEIDPEVGKFRTTVSDGQQRIWNELFDGSPVSLQPEPLGKLFWRIRGEGNRKLAFSIDSIQVRNRPVFNSGQQGK